MSRMDSIKNTFDAITGVSGRHNRALMDVRDWAASLQKFLTDYQLYGAPDVNYLLENIGEAKLDLTRISYQAKPLIKTAGKIKNQDVGRHLTDVLNALEEMRHVLINPSLRQTPRLRDAALHLRVSSEKLQDKLKETQLR